MKLLVCAMETSSNIHLAELCKYLDDSVELFGIFDSKLGTPNYDLEQLAIMGFVDAIKRLPFFLKLKNEMADLAKNADKVLLMDSSGFNLPLAKAIKKKYPNKEIIYYILPQAWAWKKGRIPKIEQYCDTLCSILPFEPSYYSQKQMISYVGHPLLDEITEYKTGLTNSGKIAYMPGSRRTEIQNLLPIYKELKKRIPNKEHVLIIPSKFDNAYIQKVYGDISEFTISKNAYETLKEAEYGFICSGTATLEATIIGTPFTLAYIAKKLDYFIATKVVKIPYIGLANIFFSQMGKPALHSEFLQEEVTVENLLKDYESMNKEAFFDKAQTLRDYLKHGSSSNVAQIIQN